ncbi:MAG: hypothetical protein Sapg2KO_37710 [Saprospiraceae bacterium]
MSNQDNNKRTNWLDQLQEQSWNLELIITGFVLFGLIQLKEFLELKTVQFHANEANRFGGIFKDTTNWFAFFNDFCGLFIFSLLLLIFIRGLWIGAIGLRYVSGDIDFDHFKYEDKIKQHLRRKIGSFDSYINSLENLSSSILALTYLIFFAGISFMLYMLGLVLFSEVLQNIGLEADGLLAKIFYYLLLLPGLVVVFDFLTLGWLKTIKIPIFSRIFFGFYRFVSAVTLSFLWRPILFNFLDQKYARWLILTIPIIMFGLEGYDGYTDYDYKFFPRQDWAIYGEVMQTSFHPAFYDDLRQVEKGKGNYIEINDLSLSQHAIESPLMKVFVKHTKGLDGFIERTDSSMVVINNMESNNRRESHLLKKGPATEYAEYYRERVNAFKEQYDTMDASAQIDSIRLDFIAKEKLAYRDYLAKLKTMIKQYYSFEVNQQIVPDSLVQLAFYVHPNLGEKGFICTFPLENVHLGINELTLTRKSYVNSFSDYVEKDFSVPFIYEGKLLRE